MARFSTIAVALTVAAAGIASVGVAQAAPPLADNRYVLADARPNANVAEHVIIRTPTGPNGQPIYVAPRKPQKIWLSMGFGF